jgi:hypothetical protein
MLIPYSQFPSNVSLRSLINTIYSRFLVFCKITQTISFWTLKYEPFPPSDENLRLWVKSMWADRSKFTLLIFIYLVDSYCEWLKCEWIHLQEKNLTLVYSYGKIIDLRKVFLSNINCLLLQKSCMTLILLQTRAYYTK